MNWFHRLLARLFPARTITVLDAPRPKRPPRVKANYLGLKRRASRPRSPSKGG